MVSKIKIGQNSSALLTADDQAADSFTSPVDAVSTPAASTALTPLHTVSAGAPANSVAHSTPAYAPPHTAAYAQSQPIASAAVTAAPVSPSLSDEVSYISGVDANGKVAPISFQTWNGDGGNPDATTPDSITTYNQTMSNAAKWAPGGTGAGPSAIGSPGGTQNYYFDTTSTFTAAQRVALAAGLKMWSAVANIQFAEITAADAAANPSKASLDFQTNSGGPTGGTFESSGAGTPVPIGSSQLYNQGAGTYLTVNTDRNNGGFDVGNFNNGGSGVGVILHEEGHFMGLGHPGPYNGNVNTATQQFSAYDSHQYTLMSYINANDPNEKYAASNPNPGATPYGDSTTWMPLDILEVQRLYGVATTGPLSGGQVFGYHDNVDGTVAGVGIHDFFDFSAITTPVVALYDTGTGNTLDLSGDASMETIDLRPFSYSSFAGYMDNLAIAFNTAIDAFVGGTAGTNTTINGDNDTITDQGTGNTVTFLATQASYTIDASNRAQLTVTNKTTGIKDVLTGVQTLVFTDATVQTSTLVNPAPTLVGATPNTVEHGQATIIGTVAPGVTGDTLSLTQTGGTGTVTLGTVAQNGARSVIYTAPGTVAASVKDAVTYSVAESTGTVTGSASVQLDSGPVVAVLAFTPGAANAAVTVASANGGLPGDTLSLVVTQAPQSGTVSLAGSSVQFTAGTTSTATPVSFAVQIGDQLGGTTPVRNFIVGGNSPNTITGNAGGNTDIGVGTTTSRITLGGGGNLVTSGGGSTIVTGGTSNNTITAGAGTAAISLSGGGNTITTGTGVATVNVGGTGNTLMLGNGVANVHGGTGDTIGISATSLTVYRTNETVFLGSGKASVADFSTNLLLKVGPTAGVDTLSHFSSDLNGIVDLLGGIGGYTTPAAVVAALQPDGHGGALLPFGSAASSLDFAGVAPAQLHATNFRIG